MFSTVSSPAIHAPQENMSVLSPLTYAVDDDLSDQAPSKQNMQEGVLNKNPLHVRAHKRAYEIYAPKPIEDEVDSDKEDDDVLFLTKLEVRSLDLQLKRCVHVDGRYVYSHPGADTSSAGLFRIGVWSYDEVFGSVKSHLGKFFAIARSSNEGLKQFLNYNATGLVKASSVLRQKYKEPVTDFIEAVDRIKDSMHAVAKMVERAEAFSERSIDDVYNYQCEASCFDFTEAQLKAEGDLELVNSNLLRIGSRLRDLQPKSFAEKLERLEELGADEDYIDIQSMDDQLTLRLSLKSPTFLHDVNLVRKYFTMHQVVLREHSIYFTKFVAAAIVAESVVNVLDACLDNLLEDIKDELGIVSESEDEVDESEFLEVEEIGPCLSTDSIFQDEGLGSSIESVDLKSEPATASDSD